MGNVAITGVTGLLGGNVAAAFVAAGWRVRAVRRPLSNARHLAHLPLDWREVSFEDTSELADAFAGAAVVVHCAGTTLQSPRLRLEHRLGNIVATRRVLDACQQARIERLIHCSSTVTCGFATSLEAVTENRADLAAPPWPDGYLISKRVAETDALTPRRGPAVVVVNPGYLLGPLDPTISSGRLILFAARGHARGWTTGRNNFVDVRDVAAGIIAAVHHGRSGERYILGGENLSYRDLLTQTAIAAGRNPPSYLVPYPIAAVAGYLGDLVDKLTRHPTNLNSNTVRYAFWDGLRYSSEKAVRDLGYRVRPMDETIRDTIAWFRQRGILA